MRAIDATTGAQWAGVSSPTDETMTKFTREVTKHFVVSDESVTKFHEGSDEIDTQLSNYLKTVSRSSRRYQSNIHAS